MSGEEDFSGPVNNKARRGPWLSSDIYGNALAAVKQGISGIDPVKLEKILQSQGRRLILLSQMSRKEYKQKFRYGYFGYHGKMVKTVLVLDDKSGTFTRDRAELQGGRWGSKARHGPTHKIMQFATAFEKKHKFLPITMHSPGLPIVKPNGEIISWISKARDWSLFARSADLANMTKTGPDKILEFSEQNIEVVYGSPGDQSGEKWESFNSFAPETTFDVMFGVHGEVLDILGGEVPASAVSEGLGPLDYIGFAGIFRKLAARLIIPAVVKGTATLAKNVRRVFYRFRLVKTNVYSYDGRVVVVVQTSKGPQPFYKRTGGGGENTGGAQKGDWAPYDGHMPNNWMIKDNYVKMPNTHSLYRWGTEEFKEVNRWLKRQKLLPAQVIPKEDWRSMMIFLKSTGVKHEYISGFR